ncbi:MarR family winged helix-turn-helix transcriptional regulator [Andreprevotia chitinilytica]|uniref:MarR family winged helix-turn-helix transcriptional regulator n=1 Tax=Andreprevotia chitinilytica TaxID=396808 RepID=UPI00068C1C1C|nr:MarR family winged helix-turn-helix transcriptional regulator [Andreprevotia chitinilytica]
MLDQNYPNPADQPTEAQAIELLFYGYRAFTAKPDALLAERGLGRVHHRILYFVGQQPDAAIGELLARLRVSKQALNGPLRELQQVGLIEAVSCDEDKRVKRLRLTQAGAALEAELTASQAKLLRTVLDKAGPAAEAGWLQVMVELAAADAEPPAGQEVSQ